MASIRAFQPPVSLNAMHILAATSVLNNARNTVSSPIIAKLSTEYCSSYFSCNALSEVQNTTQPMLRVWTPSCSSEAYSKPSGPKQPMPRP